MFTICTRMLENLVEITWVTKFFGKKFQNVGMEDWKLQFNLNVSTQCIPPSSPRSSQHSKMMAHSRLKLTRPLIFGLPLM